MGAPGVMSGCLSMGLGREFQEWLSQGGAPLVLERVLAFVWLGVSLGDEMSPVEATVPASRRLPSRRLVRFGINRFDSKDFSHWELLSEPVPLRAAARQVGRGR